MEMREASKRKRIWFWLTCWRPISKYEHVKMWEFLMKFCMAVEKDHRRFMKDIAEIKQVMSIKETKKDDENMERGMYT